MWSVNRSFYDLECDLISERSEDVLRQFKIKFIMAILLLVGLSFFVIGCTCGSGRATLNSYSIPSLENKIKIGTSKDEVYKILGRPNVPGENLWKYVEEKNTLQAVGYDVYFEDEKVAKIIKNELGNSAFGCGQLDL